MYAIKRETTKRTIGYFINALIMVVAGSVAVLLACVAGGGSIIFVKMRYMLEWSVLIISILLFSPS